MDKKRRMSIHEIEHLLDQEEECNIEILPNGEVRRIGGTLAESKDLKPITMRENLGGEYAGVMV